MYEPEVDDYVVWERETWVGTIRDEGWVYFKGDIEEPKKGFPDTPRYITIETGVKDKTKEQLDGGSSLHNKIHTLLLCYDSCWHQLKFIKKRNSKHIQHWSQYDDVAGDEEDRLAKMYKSQEGRPLDLQ